MAALFEHQLAVDIVFNHRHVEAAHQLKQLLLSLAGHYRAQRIAQARGHHQRFNRPALQRHLQRIQAQASGWVGGYLHHFKPEQLGQLQEAVIDRRLRRHDIAGLGRYAQGQLHGFYATVGNGDLRRVHRHASITHTNRHLPPQWLVARAEHIAKGFLAVKACDLGQVLLQWAQRQVVDVRHGSAKGHDIIVTPRLG